MDKTKDSIECVNCVDCQLMVGDKVPHWRCYGSLGGVELKRDLPDSAPPAPPTIAPFWCPHRPVKIFPAVQKEILAICRKNGVSFSTNDVGIQFRGAPAQCAMAKAEVDAFIRELVAKIRLLSAKEESK